MPRRRAFGARQLTPHAHAREAVLDGALDRRRQLAHRQRRNIVAGRRLGYQPRIGAIVGGRIGKRDRHEYLAGRQIGRATWRGRVCWYESIAVVAVYLKKKKNRKT